MSAYLQRMPRPVAACVRCGRVHEAAPDKTAVCERRDPGGGICGGRITWRANPDDWTECPVCTGTGIVNEAVCPRCKGDGWLMGRH